MIGRTLASFEVKSKLGEGGMGEVWLAEDTKLGREVALKLLPADVAGDADRLARFEREAKVLASLNHPNIAHLYGLETVESTVGEGLTPSRETAPSGAGTGGGGPATSGPQDLKASGPHAPTTSSPQDPTTSSPQAPTPSSPQDLKTSVPITFIVMELVDGEDLSERISRGPIPVDEAVAIALQIAEALEAAHEQGIVHRDLKPANIKIRPDGTVKVLDFGLAKAWDAQNNDASLSLSPTLTQHATAAGVIIGTAAYMSPEQAAGVAADRRADIWAFGVVLWEMLTGHKLFDGETVSHVLASVLKDEIDLDELPAETPAHLRKLIGRCLRKKPKRRLQAIGDARIALEEPEEDVAVVRDEEADSGSGSRLAWITAAVLAIATVALGLVLGLNRGSEPRVIHAAIPAPPGTVFHLDPLNPGAAVLSPDGSKIVFSAREDAGGYQLYLRSVNEGEAHALSGTDNGHYPFWSPDSRWIGFVADGKLKKIKAAGGPSLTICDAPDGKGGSWNADGVIVFAPESGTPLYRVAAVGGESTPITELDLEAGDNSHRLPRFLPDGRHLLFWARNSSGDVRSVARVIGLEEGGKGRDLVTTPTSAWYAGGHVLYVRDNMLMAQAFDPEAIEFTGDAFPVAEDVVVRSLTGVGVFSTTDAGDLLYQTGSRDAGSILQWFDRQGNPAETIADEAYYNHVVLSPDGATAAVVLQDLGNGSLDIWLVDVASGLKTRFTFDQASDNYPVWSPDGESLIFASRRSGTRAIYRKSVGGTGEVELVYASELDMIPTSWSPDGRYLLFDQPGQSTGSDLWVLDLENGPSAELLYQANSEDGAGYFSPDGRWVAYWSQESGRGEVYVTPFPGTGRRWQVSQNSGTWCQWNPDGSEIFVQEENGSLKSISVDGTGATFTIGGVHDVTDLGSATNSGVLFSIAPDGERVLTVVSESDRQTGHLDLVAGWSRNLEEE